MATLEAPRPADSPVRVRELEQEVAKLNKIRQALIGRVERSMDGQGSAFSLFQTAIVLEAQIRTRTLDLERTLSDLEKSYRDAATAREQAETARLRLLASIESFSEGFALFDAEDRLVQFNKTYLTFWPGIAESIHAGMPFAEIARLAVQQKCVIDAYRDPDGWVQRRLKQHADCAGPSVHALSNGRWMQVSERRTQDGGIVAVYTDITDLKRGEILQREAELAQKTNLLQATLDNIFEGVAVYDDRLALVAWNNEFVRLLDLPTRCVQRGAGFADFRRFNEGLGERGIDHAGFLSSGPNTAPLSFEHAWPNGRLLRIERNPMPDGGFILTFTDVTGARRTEEAIKEANESLERRVAERTAALTRLNDQLQQEIAERREVEKALQIAKSEAEQANLGKTRFLAAASHDLLQPLHSARLFISALGDLKYTKQNRALIDNADTSLRAVEDLLGALLDISKLDAGAMSHEITDFPIGTLLGPLTTEHIVLARERGLTMRYVPSSAIVRTDIRLLRRIIQNFLTNAIRYTVKGGVLLGCRRRLDGLHIEVRDTGPGIAADRLDEIFEEFKQLHPNPGRQDAGIGLGLAIVRRAARTLNLPIGTTSVVGRGSMFSVTVPYGAHVRTPEWRPPAERSVGRFANAMLLVIDDQPSVLAGMEALLAGWGCTVLTAGSGREAMDMLPRLPRAPDVVIADYHLGGGLTGVKIITRVRRATSQAIPGVVITADQSADVHALVKQHGSWLLQKPLNPAQLRSLLSSILT